MFAEQNEVWLWIMQAAIMLAAVLEGYGAVWVVKQLKSLFKTEGKQTYALAGVVSVVMALATLIVGGQIHPGLLVPANSGLLFIIVMGTSQGIYQLVKEGLDKPQRKVF